MARALTLSLLLLGACELPEAPAGRCDRDEDCREGLVCRLDGGCGDTQCDEGEVVACDAGPFLARRSCTGGAFGACAPVRCSGQGVCGLALQLSVEPGGCGPASFAAADAGWASVEVCGDGKDNDCNGKVDEAATTVCRLQAGVCAGATARCGETDACSAATYTAHAQDAGRLYEAFELACDGQDNDCDGLVDISREKSLGAGTEVALVAQRFGAPDAAYLAVIADDRPQRIRTSQWTGALELSASASQPVRVLPQAVPRTMVTAAQGPAGTFVAWRVSTGLEAALVTPAGMPLFRGGAGGPVTAGPRLMAPRRDGGADDAIVAWREAGALYVMPVRAGLSTLAQTRGCPTIVNPGYLCLQGPGRYVESAEADDAALLGFGVPTGAVTTHFVAPFTVPAESDDAGCTGIFQRLGPLCAWPSFPALADYGVLIERSSEEAWFAGNGVDLRVVLGNQDAGGFYRHSVGGLAPYPVQELAAPLADEAALALGRRSASVDAGGAWFVQRSGSRILAIAELSGEVIELSDAGFTAPSAVWSARAPGHVAVAYAASRPDGGEVVGRLLCAPR